MFPETTPPPLSGTKKNYSISSLKCICCTSCLRSDQVVLRSTDKACCSYMLSVQLHLLPFTVLEDKNAHILRRLEKLRLLTEEAETKKILS